MPSAIAIADQVAAAARCLRDSGHDTVAEALRLFLIGAGFEEALGLRPGWRARGQSCLAGRADRPAPTPRRRC
jgi:hypothetical protein